MESQVVLALIPVPAFDRHVDKGEDHPVVERTIRTGTFNDGINKTRTHAHADADADAHTHRQCTEGLQNMVGI